MIYKPKCIFVWFISVNISYHALFECTQTPESPKAWCSCQLNMKPVVFLSGQRRCPAQSLCGPSGFAQSLLPHSPTPKMIAKQQQSVGKAFFQLLPPHKCSNIIKSCKLTTKTDKLTWYIFWQIPRAESVLILMSNLNIENSAVRHEEKHLNTPNCIIQSKLINTVYMVDQQNILNKKGQAGLKEELICWFPRVLSSVLPLPLTTSASAHLHTDEQWQSRKKKSEVGGEAGREEEDKGRRQRDEERVKAEAARIKTENSFRSAVQLWSEGSELQRLCYGVLQHRFCLKMLLRAAITMLTIMLETFSKTSQRYYANIKKQQECSYRTNHCICVILLWTNVTDTLYIKFQCSNMIGYKVVVPLVFGKVRNRKKIPHVFF